MPEIASGTAPGHGSGSVVVLTGPDPEPTRSLHRQFTDIGDFGRHVVDSTQLSPRATRDAVRRGLAEGTYRLS